MRKIAVLIICILACAVAGVFFGSLFETNTDPSDIGNESVACGQSCLRIAANLYGVPCDSVNVWDICPPEGKGTLLSELNHAAPKLGMTPKITKLTWNKLTSLQSLAILHVNGNHYILADPQTKREGAIRVFDPEIGTRWYDKKTLEKIWQGTSLILTKDQNFRSSSFISSPTFWQEQGDFAPADEAQYIFPIKNDSPNTIQLKIEKLSCQCSLAKLDKETLESGEETILTASVKLEGKHGNFREHVRILITNENEKRIETFILAGTVIQQDILSAKRLFWGSVERGGTFSESFVVKDPGNGTLKNVKTFLPNLPKCLDIKLSCEKVTKSNQETAKKLNASRDDWIISLFVTIKKDAVLRTVKIPIKVQTNLPAPCNELEVVLEGEIVPSIKVEPGALLFSEKSHASGKVLVIKSTIADFMIPEPKIRIEGDVPIFCTVKRKHGQELTVDVRLNDDNVPAKTCSGNILFDFGGEGILSVPVVFQTFQ